MIDEDTCFRRYLLFESNHPKTSNKILFFRYYANSIILDEYIKEQFAIASFVAFI